MCASIVAAGQGGLVDAEDHAEGLQVAFLLALLACPASEYGRVVDEARGQVAQRPRGVVGRQGGVAEAVDLLLDDAEYALAQVPHDRVHGSGA